MELDGKSFVFGRKDAILGTLKLCSDGRIFSHQNLGNEASWAMVDGHLNFFNSKGVLKTLFRPGPGRFWGDYYGSKTIPNHHYLEPFKPSWVGISAPGRKLIYMIAMGAKHGHMAQMAVHALRGPGRYEGEIQIFCDREEHLGGLEKVTVRVIDFSALIRDTKKVSPKITLGQTLDGERYDHIMFLDCDILARKPVEGLFSHPGFAYARQHFCSLFNDQGRQTQALTAEEAAGAVGDAGINGGTFGAPGSMWNKVMDDAFWTLSRGGFRVFQGKWLSEETALVKMAYNGLWRSASYSPYDLDYECSQHPEETVLRHYIFGGYEEMKRDYETLMDGR